MLASWTYQCFLIEMEGSCRQHHRDREACCGLAAQFPKDQTTTAHTLLAVGTTPTSTRTITTPPPANGRNIKFHGVREIPISHGNQPASQPTNRGDDNRGPIYIHSTLLQMASTYFPWHLNADMEPCHQTGCCAPLGHRIDGSPAPHLLRHSQKSHSARFPRWTLIQ
ncbi:hypothetical protein GE21DRAFT_7569 [Neurospora crassa]|uniref:Uncharacterized protein n=1 Tax=Neurospora crassa (strain ATCC 24698 / 74-OR23-1A / CBS 708.71 / DSM 1257 / FGSC 987) TaxID=367110 RepID=V5IP29_NEUCR|nr:hypothetical protein NCU16980 [Neurospora crassa OR74A]ESA42506.1 hypothetical protein NCU16980 [Neurospora crassa OR74A]KHE87709.1 hypothetical protein GE21DRAFT_7569 [Neurospora crassa]|eukprot:XP_011394829.1 hypothetical protein NCU16980 [Neurospora crassa OR74A]